MEVDSTPAPIGSQHPTEGEPIDMAPDSNSEGQNNTHEMTPTPPASDGEQIPPQDARGPSNPSEHRNLAPALDGGSVPVWPYGSVRMSRPYALGLALHAGRQTPEGPIGQVQHPTAAEPEPETNSDDKVD